MVLSCTDDFEVAWQDPADAELSWGRDPLHLARPFAPLAQACGPQLAVPGARNGRVVFLNGYAFIHRRQGGGPPPPPIDEVGDDNFPARWRNEFVPRLAQTCSAIRRFQYAALSAPELASALEGIFEQAIEVFQQTMHPGLLGPVACFVEFCHEEIGADSLALAATLLQGTENDSSASGLGLSALARIAADSAALRNAVSTGDLAIVKSVVGSEAFVKAFETYLEDYGWRAEGWGLVHLPTWLEEPAVPLKLIARYLEAPDLSPAGAAQRAEVRRQAAVRELTARVPSGKKELWREVSSGMEGFVYLMESRAYWQLTAAGSLRVPLLALGKALQTLGVIEDPRDVFFLYLTEVKELARTPRGMFPAIEARKLDLQRWERLQAPLSVGREAPAPGGPPAMQLLMRAFFGSSEVSTRPDVVKGQGASRGTVKGQARVLTSLDEAGQLLPGEILVCKTSSPPWTPLFAIAAGVVTDSGGLLSHAAICAREYGVPCVVSTRVATQRIRTGDLITIDGASGTVTIVGAAPGPTA